MKLSVPDMNCGHCKASVTELLSRIDPNAKIEVDLDAREVTFDSDARVNDVITSLDAIGFDAKVL